MLVCLRGKGYTYTWPEHAGVNPWRDGKADLIRRVDYEPVGLVSAAPGGARWYHQHFGASKDPLRLTAWFGPYSPGREPGPPGETHIDYTSMDIPEGGTSIRTGWKTRSSPREYDGTIRRNAAPRTG